MAFELKDGQGTLFRNDKKEEGSKQPDHRGEFLLNGTVYEIAGWVKEGKRGRFLSLAVKPARERPEAPTPKRAADDFDDDPLPF